MNASPTIRTHEIKNRALLPFIQTIWSFDSIQPSRIPGIIAPDYQVEFVVMRRGYGFLRSNMHERKWIRQPPAFAYLQTKGCIEVKTSEYTSFVAFRTNLSTAQIILGFPATEMMDQCIDITTPFASVAPLISNGDSRTTTETVVQRIQELVEHRLAAATDSDIRVAYLYEKLLRFGADISIAGFADEVGLTRRTLERRFRQVGGCSPKRIAMAGRFLAACHLLRDSTRKDVGSVSHELGYTDQAHFSNDFRAFSGLSPIRFQHISTVHFVDPSGSR